MARNGFAVVMVEEIEPQFCTHDFHEEDRPVTHTVIVQHWFGARGQTATFYACKDCARKIEEEMRQQITKRDYAAEQKAANLAGAGQGM